MSESKRDEFTVVNGKTVYDNPWLTVEEYDVIHPTGKPGVYGKVHVKSRAVSVVAVNHSGETWLVGQPRFPTDAYSWEVPCGGADLDEPPLEAAKRELREETGVTAMDWKEIMRGHTANSYSDEEAYVFLARDVTEGEPEFDATEALTIRKLPFGDAIEMALDGRVTDTLSVAALLKVERLDLIRPDADVLLKDEHFVVVRKPAGLMVHRTKESRDKDFLLQRVRRKIGKTVNPVHRLDRATSGVMIFGTSKEGTSRLFQSFREKRVAKTYHAVARGFTPASGRIDHPLKCGDSVKEAVTDFETLATVELPIPVGPYQTARYSLVRVTPLTGRTHQIRRHFAHISHPLIGDTQYGDGKHNRALREKFRLQRLLLMATHLSFPHPMSDEIVNVDVPLDNDFKTFLKAIGFDIDAIPIEPRATK